MKAYKLFSFAALALALTACDGFELPNPPAQSNPNVDGVFANSDIAIAQPKQTELNLIQDNKDNVFATVAVIDELVNFPEGYTLDVTMDVCGNSSFDNYTTLGTVIADNQVTVNPDLLNGAIQKVITKNPENALPVYTRFQAYAVRENTRMILGGYDHYFTFAEPFTVTPLNPSKVIEQSYYLVVTTNGKWASKNPKDYACYKMNNTMAGVNAYDNPIFSVKFDVTAAQAAAGTQWQVIPASSYAANAFTGAIGGSAEAEGKLTEGAYGVVATEGPRLLTVNVEVGSYSIVTALDNLFPLSGDTYRKPELALPLYTDNYINYGGVSVLDGKWYLAGQAARQGLMYYQVADKTFIDSKDGLTRSGDLTPVKDEGVDLSSPVSGKHLYWIEVNQVMLTYKITAITSLSLVGSHNGWNQTNEVSESGNKPATALTPNADLSIWTATDVELDGMFKINANYDWNVDFGGEREIDVTGEIPYNIVYKGANMTVAKGKYDVTVNFNARPYTIVLNKK